MFWNGNQCQNKQRIGTSFSVLYLIIQDRLENNKTEAGHSRLGDLPAHQLFILRNQYLNVCVQSNGLLEEILEIHQEGRNGM